MGPHTTSDDPTRYRDKDEVERWRRRDPLARVKALLRSQDAFTDDFARDVAAEADQWGADVRSACLSARLDRPIEIFDHVYDEPHVGLDTQRAQYRRLPRRLRRRRAPLPEVRDDAAHDGASPSTKDSAAPWRMTPRSWSWGRTSASSAASSASPTGCSTSSARTG